MKSEKTIIIESGKCSWGKCIFCSFSKKDPAKLDLESFKEKIDRSLKESRISTLKFFNSGSFLDEKQISKEMRQYLFEKCRETNINELIVECRAEHVTENKLNEINSETKKMFNITFSIGLEVADDDVLKKIQKGMTTKQYERAVSIIKAKGFGVRAYLMANLPYVKDIERSLDKSVDYALKHSDSVALINTFAYGHSPLFEMWLKWLWHPLDKAEFDILVKKYRKNKKIEIYFDDYISYPKFPENMQKKLVGVGEEYLTHPYFNIWQEYISRFYEVPEGKKCVLFLPCSARKPYSQSRTHREILKRTIELRQYPLIHQVMISNAGVIPREFEAKYPFAHYDWQEWLETQEIRKEYVKVTQKRIEDYLKTHKYSKIFAYLKPTSDSYAALVGACKKMNLKVISCADEKVFSDLDKTESGIIKNADDEKGAHENLLVNRNMLDKMTDILRNNLN